MGGTADENSIDILACVGEIYLWRGPVASKGQNVNKKRVGEFLLDNMIITRSQLTEALEMQKDNPGRLIGEILVTLGALSKEQLVMAMEMYLMETEDIPSHVDEWLDQDEVDMIIKKLKEK